MKTLLVLAALPLILASQDAIAEEADALQPPDPRADTTRVLLKEADGDPAGSLNVARNGKLHRRGVEQLTVRELYADYFAAHDLTLAQSDDIVRALAEERVLTTSWEFGSVRHVPGSEDRVAAMVLRTQVEQLLGRERYAALVEYEKTLAERKQLRTLSTWLRALGQALSVEQKEALIAILVSERHRLDRALLRFPSDSPEHPAEVTALHDSFDRHVLALFEPILTRGQRHVADRQFAERSASRHEALARYARAQADGDEAPFAYPTD